MDPLTSSVFDLPERLRAKADPAMIGDDERHLSAVGTALTETVEDLAARADLLRRTAGGHGQAALERDLEVHRLEARLGVLRRVGLDVCLGRTVAADDPAPTYVGRLGLTDRSGRRLLVDWRSPAAEPFFAATHADPRGLTSRRRFRWTGERVTDYWDEVFAGPVEGHVALDDQSAFVASLGSSRSPRMRDVLGTIQADQDAIVRAGSRGALVVDGGPGTGKTVVALHRTAYLLYADPRLGHRRGGVLVVGPHEPYLAYVGDVLPGLGEEGVRTCTVRDLVPEGALAEVESDPEVARLKASTALLEAIEPAVALYEEPPTTGIVVESDWSEVWLGPETWAEAFGAADPGTPHNEAREQVWDELLTILLDLHAGDGGDLADTGEDDDVPPELLRRSLARCEELVETFDRAWPLVDAADLVGDLWTVPAYLRRCAPGLDADDVRRLQRADPSAWTVSDLPLLDAARHRLGDPDAVRRRRRQRSAAARERDRMSRVVDDLIAADDSELRLMSMLRQPLLQDTLVDEGALPAADRDPLDGPFAHVVVDEAQELDDAQWQMLLRRCPSRSLTVVGDRAQARGGFVGSWQERLARVGLDDVTVATLTINYRTPSEVMTEAEPVIREVLPDANVPTSVRSTGVPVLHAPLTERDAVVEAWLAEHAEGTACVVGDPTFRERPRVRSLAPELTKGLEFDLLVLVDPDSFGGGVRGAVDRYVAMTRATQRLVVLRP